MAKLDLKWTCIGICGQILTKTEYIKTYYQFLSYMDTPICRQISKFEATFIFLVILNQVLIVKEPTVVN